MVLEHLAVILFFSGPWFWFGLWMAVDPAGIAWLPEFLLRLYRNSRRRLAGPAAAGILELDPAIASRQFRKVIRLAGVALAVFALTL